MAFSGITIPVGRKTAITACQKTTYEKRGVNKLMNKQNKIEIDTYAVSESRRGFSGMWTHTLEKRKASRADL